jgi:hypothetical protein
MNKKVKRNYNNKNLNSHMHLMQLGAEKLSVRPVLPLVVFKLFCDLLSVSLPFVL